MLQKQEKIRTLSEGDVGLIVEKFGINRLMDSLIRRLNTVVKKFDPSKKDIPGKTEFPSEILRRTFVCLDVQEPKIAIHFKHEMPGCCV